MIESVSMNAVSLLSGLNLENMNRNNKLSVFDCITKLYPIIVYYFRYEADLATGRERQLTTGKRAERTKDDFRCSICRSATGQASCLIFARRRQLMFPFCC